MKKFIITSFALCIAISSFSLSPNSESMVGDGTIPIRVINSLLNSYNSANIVSLINQAKNETGIDVNAIRYIISNKVEVTEFPYTIETKNTDKIEMNFTVPFGGNSTGPGYNNGSFHILTVDIFGATSRGDEKRGSTLNYTF